MTPRRPWHAPTYVAPWERSMRDEQERQNAIFDAGAKLADLNAMVSGRGSTNQSPGVVVAGSEADVNDEFSYNQPHWSEADMQIAASKRIREARAYGALQRVATLVSEDHVVMGPKVRDKFEVEALAQKMFCTNCLDARLETRQEREEQHRKLAEVFGPPPNDGLDPVDDRCGTCGAAYGFRQTKVVA